MKRILPLIVSAVMLISIFCGVSADGFETELPALPQIFGFGSESERAVLFDIDTGAILYEKNGSAQAKQGSLTTIMTAMLLIDSTDPEDWDSPLPPLSQVNSRWSARGSQMGLKEDDEPTRRDLLYGLLLMGAADAAYVTEMLVSGSEAGFVELMNAKAAELGMAGTQFDNGYGLSSGSHYTCARDLALLTTEAMKLPLFEEAVASKEYFCSAGCGGTILTNTNTELGSEGCIGIRSGSDSEREHCVITAFKLGEARIAAVVLEAASDTSAYAAAKRLINAGSSIYSSEGGLYPYTPTNALLRANAEIKLYSAPVRGEERASIAPGEGVRVCGAAVIGGRNYYCVFHDGSFLWAEPNGLEFICYVDDIFIENGDSLSRETVKNTTIELGSCISTRHETERIVLTMKLPDGTLKLKKEYSPYTHGVCSLSGTTLADSIAALQLTEGIYTCTLEATVKACLPGFEEQRITKSNSSILSVGTGGECVSYNCGLGKDAPAGECFLGEFTVPEAAPSRPGHVFECWNTSPDGSGQSFAKGETVSYPSSLTLYPVWNASEGGWEVNAEAACDGYFSLDGTVKNTKGITSLRMLLSGGEDVSIDRSVSLCANEAELDGLFTEEQISLEPGEYTVELLGSAGGHAEESIFKTVLTVESSEPEVTEAPVLTPSPTEEPGEKTPFFNLAAVPIAVWFILGAAVVVGLIAAIITIIKRG